MTCGTWRSASQGKPSAVECPQRALEPMPHPMRKRKEVDEAGCEAGARPKREVKQKPVYKPEPMVFAQRLPKRKSAASKDDGGGETRKPTRNNQWTVGRALNNGGTSDASVAAQVPPDPWARSRWPRSRC